MAQNNSRIIEKDIFTSVPAAAAGSSDIVDFFGSSGGANKFSIQAVYDVQAPSAKTFDSGANAVNTATFQALVSTSGGDYLVIGDTTGNLWAVAANVTGVDPAPTGAVWASIPAARKSQVNLLGTTTAATVSTAFQNAFNALTSVPFVANDNVADCAFTQNIRGSVPSAQTFNEDDSGNGSISVALTTAGVASEVDIDANTVSVPAHGYATGLKVQLTTTGTLPGGLATATDYFLIVVDINTLKFATSLANALLGTAINITTQGSSGAVNTITATALAGASVTFQKSNDAVNWVDVQTATAITVDGSVMVEVPNVSYRYFKAVKAMTAGQVALKGLICVLGDAT